MRLPRASTQTRHLIPLIMTLIFTAACSGTSDGASIAIPATATVWQSFSQAQIAKPTYTPFPTQTATPIPPVEIPAITAEAVAQAVIVDVPQPVGYSASSPADAPPANYSGGKYILVDISEQHMYVYEGDYLVHSFVASTGMNNATRTGTFSVLEKIDNAYGATWNIWMPDWLGIYWAGSLQNGIHALPILPNGATLWAGYLGTPISYGCVVLDTFDAQVLYDWSEVGVPVEIQW